MTTSFSLAPTTLDEAMKFSDLIAKSDLVPSDYKGKPGNILVAIQMGQEVGLKPLQALQSIAVINGHPCIYGDGAIGLVRASGLLEDFREDLDEKTMTATCQAKRKDQPTPITRTFSQADANRAGLWQKIGPWKSYPQRMLQMRARSWVLRDGFADVLKGLEIAEEMQDLDVVDTQPLNAPKLPALPQRLSAKEAPGLTAAPAVVVDAVVETAPTPATEDLVRAYKAQLEASEDLEVLRIAWENLMRDPSYLMLPNESKVLLWLAKDTRKTCLSAPAVAVVQAAVAKVNAAQAAPTTAPVSDALFDTSRPGVVGRTRDPGEDA